MSAADSSDLLRSKLKPAADCKGVAASDTRVHHAIVNLLAHPGVRLSD
jgi:hypothetical protein